MPSLPSRLQQPPPSMGFSLHPKNNNNQHAANTTAMTSIASGCHLLGHPSLLLNYSSTTLDFARTAPRLRVLGNSKLRDRTAPPVRFRYGIDAEGT